jgi:aldehyde dehydrogenase (NAD+)
MVETAKTAAKTDTDPAGTVAATFEAVRAAYRGGRTRSLGWRSAQLAGIERMVVDREQEFLDALAEDFGKPRVEAWMGDLAPVVKEAAHARRQLRRWMRPQRAFPGKANLPGSAWSVPEPLGTVLVISPWNYPVQLALAPLIAALAAGNAAVLKPSELTPATSAALARLIPEYLDPDAVAVVEGAVDVATALLEQPFDHIFFTGSTAVGRTVMTAAARNLASVTLELGGKSPVIVARDADIEVTARRIAWGKMFNAGQTCIAPDYVLVERPVAEKLVDAVTRAIGELEGPDPSRTRTRIVNARHLGRLEGLLEGSGGTVATGGKVDQAERWLEPTIVVEPDPSSPLMQEEIFGPILPVIAVDSVDEAIAFVQDRPKPLALYLFTRSQRAEERVLASTTSGGVCINHVAMHFFVPELPFGGVGPSGVGAYHGRAGFEELSHRKPVLRRGTRVDLSMAYPPYDEQKEKLLRRFI